ncbi:MAG TPA: hypothetical protein VF251_03995, partial [Pyrinomonadaceae bacterium]
MMMQAKDTSRIRFTSFLFSAALIVASGFVIGVMAQETQPAKPVANKRTVSSGRDPFRKYEPPPPT